jgi:hypothetical protein
MFVMHRQWGNRHHHFNTFPPAGTPLSMEESDTIHAPAKNKKDADWQRGNYHTTYPSIATITKPLNNKTLF